MAGSVITGVVKLASKLIASEASLQLGVREDFLFIRDEFEMMHNFLISVEENEEEEETRSVAQTWINQVRELAYDVEDSLMEFSVHVERAHWLHLPVKLLPRHRIAKEFIQIRKRAEDVNMRSSRYQLRRSGSSYPDQSAHLDAMVTEIRGLVRTIARATEEIRGAPGSAAQTHVMPERVDTHLPSSKLQADAPAAAKSSVPHVLTRIASNITGKQLKQADLVVSSSKLEDTATDLFSAHKKEQADLVEMMSSSNGPSGIVVCGPRGSGKTTIVRKAYNSTSSCFTNSAWVELDSNSRQENVYDLLLKAFKGNTGGASSGTVKEQKPDGHRADVVGDKGKGEDGEPSTADKGKEKAEANAQEKASNNEKTEAEAWEQLKAQYLKDKWLVVIDGAADTFEDREFEGEKLWELLRDSAGSRVVLIIATEYGESVDDDALDEDGFGVLQIQPLQERPAMELFLRKVYGMVEYPEYEISNNMKYQVKKIVVNRCNGLPRAIVRAAKILSTKPKTAAQWKKFHDHVKPERLFDEGKHYEIASKYEGLPYYMKPCFLYMATVFSQKKYIREGRLVRRWIAEGYAGEVQYSNEPEVACRRILKDLKDNGLVKTISNNWKEKQCDLDDSVYEFAVKKSMEENFTCIVGKNFTGTSQRKIRHLVIRDDWKRDKEVLESLDLSRVRSLTVHGEYKSYFLSSKMKLLRVLDLEDAKNVAAEDLRFIERFFLLKYLGLRGAKICRLPNSIGMLSNLETLDIKDTFVTALPSSVSKLTRMRYLHTSLSNWRYDEENFLEYLIRKSFDPKPFPKTATVLSLALLMQYIIQKISKHHEDTNGIFDVSDFRSSKDQLLLTYTIWRILMKDADPSATELPKQAGKMSALQVLGTVDIIRRKGTIQEIRKFTQLRKLGVSGITMENGAQLCEALNEMENLESLLLRSESTTGALNGSLDDLDEDVLQNVRSLKLYLNIGNLPSWVTELKKLCKLYLRGTQLIQDDIEELGDLPNLIALRFWVDSFKGVEMCFSNDKFKKLDFLRIGSLKTLRSVKFESTTAVPKLRLLEVRRCPSLDEDGISGLENRASLPHIDIW